MSSERPTINRSRTGPRLRIESRTENSLEATYKGCDVSISRDHSSHPWYIQVKPFGGGYIYDGWWLYVEGFSMDEAIIEACTGAMLWEPKP